MSVALLDPRPSAASNPQPRPVLPERFDFNERPLVVIWEVTQACDLQCHHCRACAQPLRDLRELTSVEARRLIDEVAELHAPIFVFTGGDPLKRADIYSLVKYAADRGVHPSLTPSATPLLTRDAILRLKQAGLSRLAVSLDASTAAVHDGFRGVPGSWERTVQAVRWAEEAGLPLQINTTVTRRNLHDLPAIAAMLEQWKVALWSVSSWCRPAEGRLLTWCRRSRPKPFLKRSTPFQSGCASTSRPRKASTIAGSCCSSSQKHAAIRPASLLRTCRRGGRIRAPA